MGFKDILVHLDAGRNEAERIAVAVALAARHKAHLTGLFGFEPMPIVGLGAGPGGAYMDFQAIDLLLKDQREASMADAGRAESAFRTAATAAGISHEWRMIEGDVARLVTLHARYSDLAIIGQSDPDAPAFGSAAHLDGSLLLGSGRPTLFVPYTGHAASLGRRVLVAWSGTREAARAVADALPLLRAAELVTVLSIGSAAHHRQNEELPAIDISHHLARHDIKAEAQFVTAEENDAGNLILSRAADLGSDLIVMGGYGHSRMRELILGGATRHLLQHMTVPVLLSH